MVRLVEGVNGGAHDGEVMLLMDEGDRLDFEWLTQVNPADKVRVVLAGRTVGFILRDGLTA